eukprot:67175_1
MEQPSVLHMVSSTADSLVLHPETRALLMAEMDPIHDGNNASSFVFNVYGSVQFDHDFVEAPHIIEQASSRPSTDSISPFLIFAAMIRPTMGDIHSNYLDPFSLTDPASFAANPYRIGASKM